MPPKRKQKQDQADSLKKPQVNRRSFTGCETCRNRKVKCDGTKPVCQRCEKSKVVCLGYDIKLKFCEPLIVLKDGSFGADEGAHVEDSQSGQTHFQRRQVPFMSFPEHLQYKYMEDMDPILETLTDDRYHGKPIRSGPFGAFPINDNLKIPTPIDDTSISRPTGLESRRMNNNEQKTYMNHNNSNLNSDGELIYRLEFNNREKLTGHIHNNLGKLVAFSPNPGQASTKSKNQDNGEIIRRRLWIHPRLQIDARLTYKALMGDAMADSNDWNTIQQTIFSDFYGKTDEPKFRIVDKFNVDKTTLAKIARDHLAKVLIDIGDKSGNVSLRALLANPTTSDIVRLFVRKCSSMTFLSHRGGILETILTPILYKIVGEMLVFDMIPETETTDPEMKEEIGFKNYCFLLKQTFVLEALAIASFAQYKTLFNDFGIYEGSLTFLKCYIRFREISMINLCNIIEPLIGRYDENEAIKVVNTDLLNRLLSVGLIKELTLCLILAIKQDEMLNVLQNYKLLFNVCDGVCQYIKSLGSEDRQLRNLLLWFRYMIFFFRSTSTIDVKNYKITDEGYEDIDADYNMIKTFMFNDDFQPNEYNKIEIKSTLQQNNDSNGSSDDNDDDDDENDYDDEDNDNGNFSDEVEDEMGIDESQRLRSNNYHSLPARLAQRPPIEDKPPKSFTVKFHFDGNNKDYDDDYDDYSNENKNNGVDSKIKSQNQLQSPNKRSSLAPPPQMNKLGKVLNEKGEEIDALTGLKSRPTQISLMPREQLLTTASPQTVLTEINLPFSNDQDLLSPIELAYGIPLSLLDLMEKVIRLSDHRNWFLRKKIFPRNFPKICCDIEEDLMNWKLPWNLFDGPPSSTMATADHLFGSRSEPQLKFHSVVHEIVYHLSVCFYNCTLLIFMRLIKDTDPSLLQNHVLSTLNHLEALHRISIEVQTNAEIRIHPPFWCFFISGSDAIGFNLQARFDILGKTLFDAGDKWIGKQMLFEIWRGRNYVEGGKRRRSKGVCLDEDDNEDDDKETSWLDMVKGWEVSGFH